MGDEPEVDFSKLPLEERCTHKNWKARVSAYDELGKIFQRIDDDKSPEWGKYGSWVRKFPTDSNAAAQEKALDVTLLYLENAGSGQVGRVVSEVMGGVVTKCITAAKAKSKELALNIALMCVEIEKFETVQEELMKGMELKNPKVVAGCITFLTEILRSFGVKVLNLKTILKKIPVLIEDRDKTIRDETKKLIVELFRWIGPGIKVQLTAVKPIVLQEVEAELEKFTGKPQQTRYLRSQQARQERIAGDVDAGEEGVEEGVEEDVQPDIDPYELLDPVDILSKLPKDFYEKCEAKKWQDRKEAMEALEVLTANPKLEAGDYSDLVRCLKRIIGKDTNVVVVALAGKCIAGLANGLKKKFSPYAASCISTILEKFKEKKANVVTAMRDAIDACFVATSLEHIQEDTIQALQNKNPAVKLETNAFLARSFAKTSLKTMSDKKIMKPYFTAIVVNLNESDPAVREAAAEAFGVALKHVGEKALVSFTTDMEPIKLQKVKEFAEKAVITAPKEKGPKIKATDSKTGGATIVGRSDAAVKRPVAKKATSATKIAEPAAPTAAKTSIPKSNSAAPRSKPSASNIKAGGNAAAAKKSTTTAAAKVAVEDPIGTNLPINNLKAQRISDEMRLKILKWNFTTPRDEFVELLKELMAAAGVGQTLMANMFNANFKLHLKALDTLQEEFSISPEGTKANLDLILKWTTLRFFDTNPSVLIRILDYLGNVLRGFDDEGYILSDVEVTAFLPYLLLKIGDPKDNVRSNVHTIIRLIVNIFPPTRVFTFVMDALKSKNARQRQECLDELSYMIAAHGLGIIHPSATVALKEIAKQISDRDNNVRNSALNAMVQAYYQEGEKIYKMIGQLADKDQSLLDERIKRAGKTRPAPSQQFMPTVVPVPTLPAANSRTTIPSSLPPPAAYTSPQNVISPVRSQAQLPANSSILQPQNLNAPAVVSPMDECAFLKRQVSYHMETAPRITSLPEKYRIDFEAIDHMFTDLDPIGPLELLDTNVEQFVNGEQISLPKRRTGAQVPMSTKMNDHSSIPSQANQSIDQVVSQIGEANLRRATESCVKLEKMMVDSETSVIMAGRVDPMLSMIAMQMRRQQPNIPLMNDATLLELNRFFRASVALLTVLFKGEFLPKKANKDCLKEIIYHLLVLIIDDNLDLLVDAPTIIKQINVMVVRIIENAEPAAISCALIRLLNETLATYQYKETRLLELVMKCQWKLLKQYNVWVANTDYEWDVKAILAEYFTFIKAHPFNSFHNRDATPLKTIKTILHSLVIHVGCDILQYHVNEIPPELMESEAGIYLSKIIKREMGKKM